MDGGAIYQDGKDQEKVEREEIESSELYIVVSEISVNLPSEYINWESSANKWYLKEKEWIRLPRKRL